MVGLMHPGGGKVYIDSAWGHVGGKLDPVLCAQMVMAHTPSIPQLALANLILGGVFDRHPSLSVICAEYGISWVGPWLDRMGPFMDAVAAVLGNWRLAKPPREYLGENILFSPLLDDPLEDFIRVHGPHTVVFSSDYPHPEGAASACESFRAQLESAALGIDEQMRFFSGNVSFILGRSERLRSQRLLDVGR
jgi:predicted TIM-barrel fold metal-dependent hydrolase